MKRFLAIFCSSIMLFSTGVYASVSKTAPSCSKSKNCVNSNMVLQYHKYFAVNLGKQTACKNGSASCTMTNNCGVCAETTAVTTKAPVSAPEYTTETSTESTTETTVVQTVTTTAAVSDSNKNDQVSMAEEVLKLVNAERAKENLPALKLNEALSNVAQLKSEDMKNKNYFDHTSPTYGTPFNMMKQFGISYTYAGENIAKGQKTAADVVNAWMNSEGHRANILNKNFTDMGLGYVKSGNTTYWTQMFIK